MEDVQVIQALLFRSKGKNVGKDGDLSLGLKPRQTLRLSRFSKLKFNQG